MFSDVPNWRWSYKAIDKSARTGRIQGFPDGTFKPDQPLTREQMAQILYNVPYTWGQVSSYLEKCTVHITKGATHGAGAMLQNGYILTAKHVVSSVGAFHGVRFKDGNRGQAIVVATHPNADLAIIKMTSGNYPDYLDIPDESDVQTCDEIMICGHPSIYEWKLSKSGGEIVREQAYPSHEFDANIAASGGNSGGPVVDQCLDLIGIVVQSTTVNGEQGFEAINVMKFKDWIAQNTK